MKTHNKIAITAVLAMILLGSCQDYNQLVNNPNLPLTSPPSLLFTGILNSMADDNAWDGFLGSMNSNQFWISTYTYYGTNNYDQGPFIGSSFNYYSTLQNVVQMEQEAKKAGAPEPNPYSSMGKFFRAYFYNLMSQKFGDLPASEALKGADKIAPVYDTQKDLYVQILKWLDEANTEMGTMVANPGAVSVPLSGDMYLDNDLAKWQKAVNSFTLRILVSLSKKTAEAGLNVQSKFAAIVNDPAKYPVMSSNDDNVQYRYNAQFNNYPKNPGNIGFNISRENVSSTFLKITTALNDPRTFITSTPAPAQLALGKTFDDQAAYIGANPGDDMGTVGGGSQSGLYSFVNGLRYYTTYDGSNAEPAIIIGYPEVCFNIAEGINRGWATGTAATWYNAGIVASLAQLGVSDGTVITVADYHLTPYGTVTVDLPAYLAQTTGGPSNSGVLYKGDNAAGLEQILTQKYLGFWMNSNWEAFFNHRRTGVPTFLVGPGTGNGGVIPERWQYPYGELTANKANYEAAVSRQFTGSDNLNGKLWINQ